MKHNHLYLLLLFLAPHFSYGQKPRPPIMGWSSWNHFAVNIIGAAESK